MFSRFFYFNFSIPAPAYLKLL